MEQEVRSDRILDLFKGGGYWPNSFSKKSPCNLGKDQLESVALDPVNPGDLSWELLISFLKSTARE